MRTWKRCWTAYEKNQLLKYKVSLNDLDQFGEKPVEYITGKVTFLEREFLIDDRALIPRLESEELVQLAVDFALKHFSKMDVCHILDVGTGSGNIGISTFLELKKLGILSSITMSDISSDCLQLAQENIFKLISQKDQSCFKLIQSNLLNNIPNQKYHIIVANLPYIPSELLKILDNSVTYYEPDLALDGGEDGLELVRSMLSDSSRLLANSVGILLEIDSRSNISSDTLGIMGTNFKYRVMTDSQGKQRFVIVESLLLSK